MLNPQRAVSSFASILLLYLQFLSNLMKISLIISWRTVNIILEGEIACIISVQYHWPKDGNGHVNVSIFDPSYT